MTKYKVIENLPGENKDPKEFDTFKKAKAYLDQTINEWYDIIGCDPSLRIVKISDILYNFCGRNAGRMGSIYLKKIAE